MPDTSDDKPDPDLSDADLFETASRLVASHGKLEARRLATERAKTVSGVALLKWVKIRQLIDLA